MAELALEHVGKVYRNGYEAIHDFSLEIKEGEFLILVGPSGCGKSTLLRMIAGLEDISSGELWVDGEIENYKEPRERNLAMVFQNYALYPNMSVYDNIAFSLSVRKVDKKERKKKYTIRQRCLALSICWTEDRENSLAGRNSVWRSEMRLSAIQGRF